jgi:hypothetical protein
VSARYLPAWARERFPLANGVFFSLLYVLALLVGRSGGRAPLVPLVFGWRDLPGLAALWTFFLWLRVLDEHKDYANDLAAHPDRVLQRGLVTLADLRVVGVAALALQAGVSLWIDGRFGTVTTWWLVALGWSLLMAKEFFVGAWLRRHIMWYAISHLLVMVPLVSWVASMGTFTGARLDATMFLAALVWFGALAFEVARKLRAPEDEHPLADSYTQSLGITKATRLLMCVMVALALLTLMTTAEARARHFTVVLIAIVPAIAMSFAALIAFRQQPTRRAAKMVEKAVGLASLLMHAALLGALIQTRGIVWR